MRASDDFRLSMGLRSVHGKSKPWLTITCAGDVIVSELIDIGRRAARDEVVSRCAPADPADQLWMKSKLCELAEEWSASRPSGVSSRSDALGALDASPLPFETTADWPDAVDLALVLDEIVVRVNWHLFVPQHVDVAVALWVAATHTFGIVNGRLETPLHTMPLFWVFSATKGCGKSRLLSLLHVLCIRSIGAENSSTSAAFRTAAKYFPTLIFDEIDTWLAEDKNREFLGFLNASFTAGGSFVRTVGDNYDVRQFPVFGPRAFAGIGTRLSDATRSRCVRAALKRKPLSVKVESVSTTSQATARWARPLRARVAKAVAGALVELTELIAESGPQIPPGVEDRAADAWSPLLAIAEIAGGTWPDLARAACLALTREAAEQDEEEGDVGLRLLKDASVILASRAAMSITPVELQAALRNDESAPWADFAFGKPISTRKMATMLGLFGVKSHKLGGSRQYSAADIRDALAVYLPTPASELENASKASNASQ